MENLERCVEKLDMRSMPQYLDDVSDKRENEASRYFAISLYAELARVHKQAVIPFIPRMMASIVRSLPFSADSQQLHEACAKVVTSVVRYTINPTRSFESNKQILCDVCLPLLPLLSSKLESAAAGAAICLQALVESEKWKFAPLDVQESICARSTTALREHGSQTVIFFHLVKSLAKLRTDVSKRHSAEWLEVGLETLQANTGLWQKHLAAAQLVTAILKICKTDELGIDLDSIIKSLNAQKWDRVAVVQMAIAEAFETAQGIALERQLHFGAGKLRVSNVIHEGQTEFIEAKESELQEMYNPCSPMSGASSQESVPSMASSRVIFGTEPKHINKREKNSSNMGPLNGRPMQTSMHEEDTPRSLPRRVLSEIPATKKRLSNSEILPRLWESKSLRSSSIDLGGNVCSHLVQNQSRAGSRKHARKHNNLVEHAHPCDDGERAASDLKSNVDGLQKISFHDSGCNVGSGKPLEGMIGGQSDINGKDEVYTDGDLHEHGNDNAKSSTNESCDKVECLQPYSTTSDSDGVVHVADSSFCVKNTSVEGKREDLGAIKNGGPLKVENIPQVFKFRSPCVLLDSMQETDLAKDKRQSCKEYSDSETRASIEHSWTSESVASGDSEQVGSLQSRNPSSEANCCTSDVCVNNRFRVSSYAKSCSCQNTCDTACSLSSALLNHSKDGACMPGCPTSRVSSEKEGKHTTKTSHRIAGDNVLKCINEIGSKKHSFRNSKMKTGLPVGPDARFSEIPYSGKESIVLSSKSFGEAALGLFCAFGVLILAFVAIQHFNNSFEWHAMVPT